MYKSEFESTIASVLKLEHYETTKISYIVPETTKKYIPDFPLNENLFLETKGLWYREDRQKMLLVIEQNPDKKFILYFQNARKRISKQSKTTYADFCDKHGIEWYCWRTKRLTPQRLQELKELYGH